MNELIINEDIRNKIYSIRNMQVILDRDLAELYDVETRVLKQAVKRNIERFPSDFMFELNDDEIEFMVSQSVIPSKQHLGGAKPFAFTEQGVSAVAAILTSKIAVEIHINIIRTFVNMRKFISTNALIFERLNSLENKQFKTDKKIETILNAIEDKSIKPKQGIFYDGQMFDAHTFVSDLIRSAKIKIIIIDNYVDDSVLTLLSKNQNINVIIYTKSISKQLKLDLEKYNLQYKKIEIKKFENSHDRFMIIDDKELYHIGASLKDLGKKWFAFSKMDLKSFDVLEKLDNCRSVGI
ncbi:DNA-binding protein [Malaciobacter halophilus]|uniref:DNA-binding protein n=1 Tax=Malaciobacter halophilus TaxID=197482 RepID=A0A2N1J5Z7_9BACT|nr:ORF6N domain-containing protein [Malaciobacter halophilus]AXH09558.1 ORF6N domain-containing protein [Malaciobacter halophilus]PKI81980.1 DNA-binding protein [Malaciobacter halophilus]